MAWCGRWDQELRFESLLGVIPPPGEAAGCTLLDVGCGLGHLLPYLRRRGLGAVDYTGVDVLPEMVDGARARYPDGRFVCADVLSDGAVPGPFDVVVCSGALNVAVDEDHAAPADHAGWVERMLAAMWQRTGKALAFNALDVECRTVLQGAVETEDIVRSDRERLRGLSKALSPRVVMREDVLPGELVVWVFRGPSDVVTRWAEQGGADALDVAMAHLESRLPEAALTALRGTASSPDADNLRAVAYLQLGSALKASRILRRVVAAAEEHLDARRNLAAALSVLGDALGAIEQWRAVVDADPWDDRSRAEVCKALLRLGDVEAAAETAAQVLDGPLRAHLQARIVRTS